VLIIRFANHMITDNVQIFWSELQRGEFISDAAVAAGTYRKQGTPWVIANGGVLPRRRRPLAAGLPRAVHVDLPWAGHLPNLERPTETTQLIRRSIRPLTTDSLVRPVPQGSPLGQDPASRAAGERPHSDAAPRQLPLQVTVDRWADVGRDHKCDCGHASVCPPEQRLSDNLHRVTAPSRRGSLWRGRRR